MTTNTNITENRTIYARRRDLNASGKGKEEHRLIVDLEARTTHWATDAAIVVSDDWCRAGMRAAERRCSTRVEVPVGTIIIDVEKSIGYRSSSPASYAVGIVASTEASPDNAVLWESNEACPVQHVGVRRDGSSFRHVLEVKATRERIEVG